MKESIFMIYIKKLFIIFFLHHNEIHLIMVQHMQVVCFKLN